MRPIDVRRAVREIREVAGDGERAHASEDKLYLAVLTAISRGEIVGDEAVACAKAAIASQKIAIARHCA